MTDSNVFALGAHSSSAKDDEIVAGAEFEIGARYRLTQHISISAAG